MAEPLGLVARIGNLDMLRSLIEEQSYDARLRDTNGKTLLHQACAGGHLDMVKYLIGEHQLDPESKDNDERTPLHWACQNGHLHIVRYLVNEQSVDPEYASGDRDTPPPLHVACLNGHLEVVKFLIEEKGCDHTQLYQSAADGMPRSPLHGACESGNVDLVRYLVDEQSVNPDKAGSSVTPLHVACSTGQLEVVKFLIEEKKCDLTTFQKKMGEVWNVLHMASECGHVDIARYLIEEKQFDPMSKIANTDLTPLSLACCQGHLDVVKYLVDEKSIDPVYELKDGITPLHFACVYGHLKIVKFLIEEKGCDPMYNGKAETPYVTACSAGHLDVVRYLTEERQCDPLAKGAEGVPVVLAAAVINKNNNIDVLKYFVEERRCDLKASGDYEKALAFAIWSGNLQAFQYLSTGTSSAQNEPIPPNISLPGLSHQLTQKQQGEVPQQTVELEGEHTHLGHLEVVKFLIEEKRCDVTETFQNKAGLVYNVLDLASMNGCVDVARYLIEEMHCDPKGDPTSAHTPLILACEAGHSDMVKYLVNEKSINPFCEQNSGDTPFHVACKKGQLEIIKYLIEEKGCDPMYNNGKNIPPYSLACTQGHLNVVRYLTEERHCDPLCEDVGNVTAVDVAAGYGIAVLKYFIEERKCEVNASRLLVFAIRMNNFEAVQYLSTIETSGTTAKGTSHVCSTSRGLSSSGSKLSEPINPQRKRKQQDANEVPQHVLHPQYKIEATPTNIPLSGILRHLLSQRQQAVELEGEDAQPEKVPLPQHHLNPDDLAFLMNHLKPVANHWRAVGLQLGLLYGELGVIEATPLLIPGGPVAYLQEVLSRWLDRAPPFPTLKNLCDALRSHAVDHSRIALELQQQYQTRRAARRWEDDPELKPLVKKAEPTGRQLGVGAYGSVEQVKVEGTMYAAKRFRVEIYKSPSESHEKFFAELRILCSICHPNIVQYHCVCYLPNSKSPALVMEQLQTNLHDYLLNPSYANLSLNAKVSILQDIARGLAYLHNHKPAVIHRDLTARNVLLNSDRVAKISDFGNSRIIDIDPACSSEFISTSRVPGTTIYMPPEASSDHAKFNEKLDIFSFGHLALFTATQVMPCDLLSVYDDDRSCFRTEVERRQRYINHLEQQLDGDHELVKLIKQCLHNSPKVRPTANDTVCILEQLVAVTQTWFIQ